MSDFEINDGCGNKFRVKQGVGDLIAGIEKGDLSRISAYSGKNKGLHVGSSSKTLGRHGTPFGKKK